MGGRIDDPRRRQGRLRCVLLGTDGDTHSGGSAHEEKDAGDPGEARAEPGGPTGLGSVPALRPRHDHAKPGYASPPRISQWRRSAFRLPQGLLLA